MTLVWYDSLDDDKMLSTITQNWPPEIDPSTGWKMKKERLEQNSRMRDTLTGLHEPGWWTGVLLTATPGIIFSVKLVAQDGQPAFPESCEWAQESGVWTPLPWPIPAAMATKMDLQIHAQIQTQNTPSQHVAMKVAFHYLPDMIPKDLYLFVREDGAVLQMWNGRNRTWGTADKGSLPIWQTLHIPIPPMSRILDGTWPWPDTKVFCIHAWDEIVPMNE